MAKAGQLRQTNWKAITCRIEQSSAGATAHLYSHSPKSACAGLPKHLATTQKSHVHHQGSNRCMSTGQAICGLLCAHGTASCPAHHDLLAAMQSETSHRLLVPAADHFQCCLHLCHHLPAHVCTTSLNQCAMTAALHGNWDMLQWYSELIPPALLTYEVTEAVAWECANAAIPA